jgi:hypothetical protein
MLRRVLTWHLRRRLARDVLLALVTSSNVQGHPSTLIRSARFYADLYYGVEKP